MAPVRYLICTSPRSGSTLLCTMLRATGCAGWPESYLHGESLADWAKGLDFPDTADFDAICRVALENGRAGGDVFGARQQMHSFPLLLKTLAEQRPEHRDRDRLEGALGSLRFVYLTRGDKLGQAISLLRAEQSGLWHRNADGTVYEALPPRRASGYDREAITTQGASFEADDAAWEAWFASEGIAPHRVAYEALAADPHGELARVLGFLDLDPAKARKVQVPLEKLADAQSEDWRARYLHAGG